MQQAGREVRGKGTDVEVVVVALVGEEDSNIDTFRHHVNKIEIPQKIECKIKIIIVNKQNMFTQ